MAIQIGAKPDSGFDDPLGMLKDCHRRIESFLEVLCLVAERAKGRTLTDEEKSAVHAALKYFRTGGQRHTADEEASLFPRLRASNGLPSELAGLETDHRDAEDLHESIERIYLDWVASGALGAADQDQLLQQTARLKQLYQQHIRIEETILFPRAAQVLDGHAIAAMGAEFQSRRNQA